MATDTHKYMNRVGSESRHSALEEFSRDERRPAVLLLSALALAVLFFAIGLLFGRWTAEPSTTSSRSASAAASASAPAEPTPQPTLSQVMNGAGEAASDSTHRFTLLIATFDAPEKAQPLIKILQEAGYKDVRLRAVGELGETRASYSVLVGHFTQAEARTEAQRMRSVNNLQLKNAKVIEEQ